MLLSLAPGATPSLWLTRPHSWHADDPYLGASGAPYPPPQRIMSPANANAGGNPYYDPYAQAPAHQQGPPQAQGQPYYPPRSVSPFAAAGASQGQGASGPGSRSGTPPAGMLGYRPPSVPLEQQQQHQHYAYQDQQTEALDFAGQTQQQQQGMYAPASPTHSQQGAGGGQHGPVGNRGLMRLSIANPEE